MEIIEKLRAPSFLRPLAVRRRNNETHTSQSVVRERILVDFIRIVHYYFELLIDSLFVLIILFQ